MRPGALPYACWHCQVKLGVSIWWRASHGLAYDSIPVENFKLPLCCRAPVNSFLQVACSLDTKAFFFLCPYLAMHFMALPNSLKAPRFAGEPRAGPRHEDPRLPYLRRGGPALGDGVPSRYREHPPKLATEQGMTCWHEITLRRQSVVCHQRVVVITGSAMCKTKMKSNSTVQ